MRPFRQVRKNARSKPQIPKLMPLLGSSRNFTSKTHMFECGRRPTDNPAGSTRNLARMANNTDRASIPARWDGLVSEFLELVGALGIEAATEQCLKFFFDSDRVVFWEEIPSMNLLHSRTAKLSSPHTQGLAGFCFTTRRAHLIANASEHANFCEETDGKWVREGWSVLLCPVADSMSVIVGVIEVVSPNEMSEDDLAALEWFAQKLRILSKFVLHQDHDTFMGEMMALSKERTGQHRMFQKMCEYFECRCVEVWRYAKAGNTLTKFTETGQTPVDPSAGGIAMEAIRTEYPVNVCHAENAEGYEKSADGESSEAVLAIPVSDAEYAFAIVLRGPKFEIFARGDVRKVKQMAFQIALCVDNLDCVTELRRSRDIALHEREAVQELLGGAEILCSELEENEVITSIVEQGKLLTGADRCSLYLDVDARGQAVKYYLKDGKLVSAQVSVHGIGMKVIEKGEPVNEPDVYKCELFDAAGGEEDGYHTMSMVCVPVRAPRGDLFGFIEMRNSDNGERFEPWHVSMLLAFNVFCGIALENARLYKDSVAMSKKIHNLVGTAMSLSKSEDIRHMLSDVMSNAKRAIGADRVSVLMLDDGKEALTPFITDDVPLTSRITKGLVIRAVKTKECVIENNCYANPEFNDQMDKETGYRTNKLLVVPINNSNDDVIGVIELLNKINGNFDKNDLEFLTVFITFASVVFENSKLREKLASVDGQIMKLMTPEERRKPCIPALLELTEGEKAKVNTMDCFAGDFKGVGHFKECFYFFQTFHLLEKFAINSEQFFRFVYTISERYTSTPYHNWTHACDVLQCVFFQLKTANVDQIYESWEIFTLLVAAVCHDTNHEGFNNVFNLKAETPLGILFKDQSVMEIHHITESIPIISRPDINLFGHFDNTEVKGVWKLFIQLILATDMAHHGDIVARAKGAVENGPFNFKDPELRLLGLQLLLKVADISNVARPFAIANKWCDILNEEFFHQGDLEKETIGLTSPMNDRNASNKPKSQIAFYTYVCAPLYNVVAKIYPPLQVNVAQLEANQACWVKLAEDDKSEAKS